MGKTNDAPEMNEFLMACANSGLFPLAGFSPEHVERLSFSSVLRDCFEKRTYLIRHPVVQDLPRLMELDAACWPEPLRTGAGELRARVERFPSGHCVMEMEGSIVGAVYSQRIRESYRRYQRSVSEPAPVYRFRPVVPRGGKSR